MDTFVARQPIFDSKLQVYGYELLFRSGPDALVCDADPNHASTKVIADSLMVLGYETVTSGRLAFVNIPRAILVERQYALLPPRTTVLEILEDVPPDDDVLRALREARGAGYRIALDDYIPGNGWERVLDLVDMLKVDVLDLDERRVRSLGEQHRHGRMLMVAEKVEDRAMLDRVRAAHYTHFQGFFFARPVTASGRDIPASKLSLLRLLEEIHRPDLDLAGVQETIGQELALSYKLLRFLGSAYFGWRQPVTSIRHALMLMGEEEFRRWASVMALAGMASDKPGEIVTEAVLRGRYCQGVAEATSLAHRATDLFLVGMFSLIDAILDRPVGEVLEQVALDDDVKRTLTGGRGPMRDVLDLVLAHIGSDWEAVDTIAGRLGLQTDALPPLHERALRYANGALGTGAAANAA